MKELAEVLIKKEQIEGEIGIKLPYVFHGFFLKQKILNF